MRIKCLIFGHKLKITKNKSYKGEALECIRCGRQFSGWKNSRIDEALLYNDGKRFILSTIKDDELYASSQKSEEKE